MQVYVELAILENFCMDYTLLYCAKLVSKNPAGWKRISLAAVTGACFAVIFPLIPFTKAWAVTVKILSGLIISLAAGKFNSFKSYVKFTAAFLLFSAVLAGGLVGIFALTGMEYIGGNGYVLASVPVGIPLFGALMLIIAARAIKARLSSTSKNSVNCSIYAGQSSVSLSGFFDSGNKVYCRGAPVSVIPDWAARKITDIGGIKERVKIHTVSGSKEIKVFTADRLEIDFGSKSATYRDVKIGISIARIDCALLHPDFLED